MSWFSVIAWIAALLAGLLIALVASQFAVRHTIRLAARAPIPPFVLGITLLALGTDLPEIANSIVSCLAGHGDLNLGDSVGSTVTQASLVLGLLPLLAGAMLIERRRVAAVGVGTVVCLGLGAFLAADGYLSRQEGIVLLACWLAASWGVQRIGAQAAAEPVLSPSPGRMGHDLLAALAALTVVGLAATVAVAAFVELSQLLSVPEYVMSYFVASLGTSLPELFVNVAASRKGQLNLAVGGVLGACLVDSTLSVGIGPIIAPVEVTADLAIRGALSAMFILAAVTTLLVVCKRHNAWSGIALVSMYFVVYWLLLGG